MGLLHVRYSSAPGMKGLGFAIERIRDLQVLDFQVTPRVFRSPAPAGSTPPFPLPPTLTLLERFPGSYEAEVDATTWTDGNYAVKITNAGIIIAVLPCAIVSGDDFVPAAPVPGKLTGKATIVFDPA